MIYSADSFRHALSILWLAFFTLSVAFAQTSAGTNIQNQASASFSLGSTGQPLAKSNPVETTVPAICGLSITPDGTLTEPAQRLSALPAVTTYLAYRLVNTGNTTSDYSLSLHLDAGATLRPEALGLYHDLNGDGFVTEDEPLIADQLEAVAVGETIDLVAALSLPDDASLSGEAYLNLVGSCSNDPTILDDANVTQVIVSEGGINSLQKSADPANGVLMPGQALSYTISFEVNGRALEQVLLEDRLDPILDLLDALVTVNGVAHNELVTFDETSRLLALQFESLAPADRVELILNVQVREDAPGNYVLSNKAQLSLDGQGQDSNEVSHSVAPVCSPTLDPSGDLTAPAHRVVSLPGERLVLPYSLRNDGNVTSDFGLTASLLTDLTTVLPTDFYLVSDANANGRLDEGEDVRLDLAAELGAGEERALLLVAVLPEDEGLAGDVFIDVTAFCISNPEQRDERNIAQLILPLGGFSTPVKEAEPAAGTAIAPGGEIRYTIRFEVNARPLDNVELRDPLPSLLGQPEALSARVNGRELTSAVRYDADRHTVFANFTRLEIGAEVELSFRAKARTEVLRLEQLENRAFVSAERSAERATNTVIHALIPIDILLVKEADAKRVEIGETLGYSLRILNPSSEVTVERLELKDDLPEGLRYVPGSSRVTYPDGSEEAFEPELEGQTLRWRFDTPLPPGGELLVRFDTTVRPQAATLDELLNRAQVLASDASGSVSADASAAVVVRVEAGLFDATAVLLGTVFIDVDQNGRYDEQVDRPVSGVRLYLADGRSLVTDERGRYTFLDLRPGLNSLRVDTLTLPPRLFKETLSENKPGLWPVRLEPGLISQQDIPLLPPGVRLDLGQQLELEMGPLRVEKRLELEQGMRLILRISATETLRDVVLEDSLPAGAQRKGPARLNGDVVQFQGQRLELAQLLAGDLLELSYDVSFEGNPHALLRPPSLSWSLR